MRSRMEKNCHLDSKQPILKMESQHSANRAIKQMIAIHNSTGSALLKMRQHKPWREIEIVP